MKQVAAGDAVQLAGTDAFHTTLGHAAAAAVGAAVGAAVAAAVPGAAEAKGRGRKRVRSHQEVQILALQLHCPVQLGC